MVDWKTASSKDVLGEGTLDRSMTLPQVHDFIISPRMDRRLSEEGVDNLSNLLSGVVNVSYPGSVTFK